jgi:uncharacterized protein (DUF302 family)
MKYYFSKITDLSFDEAVKKAENELSKEGFGILTRIDVAETFKKKINKDFRRYQILGACNPEFAFKALSAEDKIGTMLPCNVIVQEAEEGKTEVAAVDPVVSMSGVENSGLEEIASMVRQRLEKVIENI